MPDERWSDDAQRYFDREGPPPGAEERVPAERLARAIEGWADGLPELDATVDVRVMDAVRARADGRRRRRWRVLVEPRWVPLRPVLAAAAALVLMVLSSLVTVLVQDRSGGEPVATAAPEAGTVLVRFELVAPGAERVALAGTFNGWSDSSIVFARAPGGDAWTVTVALRPGRYQYLFVVDGERWLPDPDAHAQIEDEFGQRNSLLVVGPRGVVRS